MLTVFSFSGGRTSAFMTACEILTTTNSLVVFMNTGLEDERTLEFVQECDEFFNLKVVWLEAVVRSGRAATGHRVVNFNTATRGRSIFESMVQKYGLPSRAYPHCTRELKLRPFESYTKSLGCEFKTAIGIRADEMDRVNPNYISLGIDYPLVRANVTKRVVLDFFQQMPFNLRVPEHRGNCITCWKKSDRKLFTLAKEDPSVFDDFRALEIYENAGAGDGKRRFFRKQRTVDELLVESRKPFNPFVDPEYDEPGGCGESCEVF